MHRLGEARNSLVAWLVECSCVVLPLKNYSTYRASRIIQPTELLTWVSGFDSRIRSRQNSSCSWSASSGSQETFFVRRNTCWHVNLNRALLTHCLKNIVIVEILILLPIRQGPRAFKLTLESLKLTGCLHWVAVHLWWNKICNEGLRASCCLLLWRKRELGEEVKKICYDGGILISRWL